MGKSFTVCSKGQRRRLNMDKWGPSDEMSHLADAGISISPVFSSMFTSFVISTAGRPGHLQTIVSVTMQFQDRGSHPEYTRNREATELRSPIS